MEAEANHEDGRRLRPCTRLIKIVSYVTHAIGLLFTLGSTIASAYLLVAEGRQYSCIVDEKGISGTVLFTFTSFWLVRGCAELLRVGLYHTYSACRRDRPYGCMPARTKMVIAGLYILVKLLDMILTVCGVAFYVLVYANADSCAVRSFPRLIVLLHVIFVYVWIDTCFFILMICTIGLLVAILLHHHRDGEADNPPVTETIVNQVTRLVTGEDVSSDTEANASDSEEGGPVCTICLSALRGDDAGALRRLGCGHTFHSDCIMPHLTQHSATCPLCRQNIGDARDLRSDRMATDTRESTGAQNTC